MTITVIRGGTNKRARLTLNSTRRELSLGEETDETYAVAVAERIAEELDGAPDTFRGDILRHGDYVKVRMRSRNRRTYIKFRFDRHELIPS
ncbi:hypothetical protein [Nocardia farcinica]|uniref:Uncharacterized protein n=1 Tax=Nocardia farcinica (strain IFM 10152) TaxID=247156 RepID=Q5YSN9_NOCFA|nr:hypothetical protein [Nocardia farcinica]BAD58802.1 hypothetical protein NFA_39540 [Nocardia farcinica IFM 10152]